MWSFNTIQNTTFKTYFTDFKSKSAGVRPDQKDRFIGSTVYVGYLNSQLQGLFNI